MKAWLACLWAAFDESRHARVQVCSEDCPISTVLQLLSHPNPISPFSSFRLFLSNDLMNLRSTHDAARVSHLLCYLPAAEVDCRSGLTMDLAGRSPESVPRQLEQAC